MSPCRIVVIISAICLTSVLAELHWDHPCWNVSPEHFPMGLHPEDYVLNFTHECPEGRIRWDYPQGTFQINFSPINKAPFKICLKADYANFIHEMFVLVDGKKETVAVPTEGNDSCVQSHDNEVQLLLVAPPELYYVTFLDFVTKLT